MGLTAPSMHVGSHNFLFPCSWPYRALRHLDHEMNKIGQQVTYSHDMYSHYGLYSYGLDSHGLYSYGLYSYGQYRYGLYSHGIYSHGLYSYGSCDGTGEHIRNRHKHLRYLYLPKFPRMQTTR